MVHILSTVILSGLELDSPTSDSSLKQAQNTLDGLNGGDSQALRGLGAQGKALIGCLSEPETSFLLPQGSGHLRQKLRLFPDWQAGIFCQL